jgi:hypothetical protein
MCRAIDLNNDLCLVTDKVGNVLAHGRLAPKAESFEAMSSELLPKKALGGRLLMTQTPGAGSQLFGYV